MPIAVYGGRHYLKWYIKDGGEMKKYIIILTLCLLCFTGCQRRGNELASADMESESSSVGFLTELAAVKESETEAEELFPFVGAETVHAMNLYDMEKNPIMGKSTVYEGEEISVQIEFRVDVKDEKVEDMTTMVFLLNDGIPQPFYWEDATEETMFVAIDMNREKDCGVDYWYNIRFRPSYVPYGSDTCMTFVMMTQLDYHFTNPFTSMMTGGGGLKLFLTAASEEYAVSREESIPVMDGISDYEWKSGTDSDTLGIAVTNKITKGEQLYRNTAFTNDEPLYATFVGDRCEEDEKEIQLFAFMDGKPLYAFDGSFYCLTYTKSKQLCEIPLDMSQIPPGEHLIYFLDYDTKKEGYIAQKYEKNGSGAIPVAAYVYNITIPE